MLGWLEGCWIGFGLVLVESRLGLLGVSGSEGGVVVAEVCARSRGEIILVLHTFVGTGLVMAAIIFFSMEVVRY